ncbi:unnamed protein product [Medioppia subpectinata]|uniref:C3H1-type domain-containing protein n=1 Tax=Medioppia subpectinata TaxID=1979941 RepID=A0A7R9KMI3_9ACAR|nr:unnamed protein product [Medioppia subpectinata]CAG2106353.1 unnamed protein product [Medioppia subpectinata]
MSAALVSSTYFGDFGDHYRSNGSTTLQNSSKNSFGSQLDKKSTLQAVYNSVQQNNTINSNHNNNTINGNVMTRRLVTTTASVPINLSHSSHRLQSSSTVPPMHQKSAIGVTNTHTPIALVRGLSSQCSPTNATINANNNNNNNSKEHKKLDRSYSEPAEKSQQQLVRLNSASATVAAGPMSSRYKTELCRSFGEVGTCKYGDKCQFAHGGHELRIITRHPKFKTENCKSFHSTGFCPYGPRCHFIHNSEEAKKSMLNNLSTTGGNGNGAQQNGLNNNGHHSQNRMAEQMMNNLNNNSLANNGFGQTYHSNQSSHPLRPKALSIGSYSLGSSGEISPPSSQSGSPTSLNSFFTEDPFNPFVSPTNHTLGSCANNAFSFSPDFASLVPTNKSSAFGGSQPTLCPPFGITANLNADISNESAAGMPAMFSNQFQTSNNAYDEHMNDGMQSMSTTPPSQPSKLSYPVASESPVDSIASDVEALKLDHNNSQGSSSPSVDMAKAGPRLPIFARFASNGNTDSD